MKQELVITGLFGDAAARYADKAALQVRDEKEGWVRFAYKDVEGRSRRIAAFLIRQGYQKGDRAALILENCPHWAMIYLGMMYAGLACVPMDPQLSREEIAGLLLHARAKILFCSHEIYADKIAGSSQPAAVKAVIAGRRVPAEGTHDLSELEGSSTDGITWPRVFPRDIASLIYTSGTTGRPKGVMLSHGNICSNFLSLRKAAGYASSDTILAILPLYHAYAFMATLAVPLFSGATVVFCPRLNPAELAAIIRDAQISVFVAVPQVFSLFHKGIFERFKKVPAFLRPFLFPFIRAQVRRRFKSLRLSVSGGARLEPQTGRDLYRAGMTIVEGYGLTETSPVVTLNPPERIKFGSAGKPIPGVRVKILDPDTDGIGQILISGPNIMQGYYRDPEKTAEAVRGGWFYSADLGFIDKQGYLHIAGRQTDVIGLSSGKKIYPEELEEYYLRSPYIKEICLVARKEKAFGQFKDALHAVIVPDLEHFQRQNEPNIREKLRWELENLGKDISSHKHVMGFTVTANALPRTVLKKIKRHEVARMYLQDAPEAAGGAGGSSRNGDEEISGAGTARKVIRYLSSQIHKPVHPHSHLEIDLGIDSLARVELGRGLEDLLKIEIPDELFYSISTVKDLIAAIERITGAGPAEAPQAAATKKSWARILKDARSSKAREGIQLEFGMIERAMNAFVKIGFLFVFRLFWRFRARGTDNLPGEGPYLIYSNHASYLDGLFIFSGLPFRASMNTYFLGFQRIFEHPALRWAKKTARLISIDAAIHLTEALEAVSFVTARKKIVCIFPEGMRSIDEDIKDFKKGIGILAKELEIPAVPAYIRGSHHSWPRGKRLPRFHPVEVAFGRPVTVTGGDYEAAARALREELIKLSTKNA